MLRATYDRTSTNLFAHEFGKFVLRVCDAVPGGVLLFVSSYRLMRALVDNWSSNGVCKEIEKRKVLVEEPRVARDLEHVMRKFNNAVLCPTQYGECVTGALLVAIYRGKISEGVDFADHQARAVIALGIPFPNFKDKQVELKRAYNDQRRMRAPNTLTGSQWYDTQAYRALNQALGRCIRHRLDWGALILVDDRFVSGKVSAQSIVRNYALCRA
jgi:Fanconi anemia group J protein